MIIKLIQLLRSVIGKKMPIWLSRSVDEIEDLIQPPTSNVDLDPPIETCTGTKGDGSPCRAVPNKESGRCHHHPLPTAGANIGNS